MKKIDKVQEEALKKGAKKLIFCVISKLDTEEKILSDLKKINCPLQEGEKINLFGFEYTCTSIKVVQLKKVIEIESSLCLDISIEEYCNNKYKYNNSDIVYQEDNFVFLCELD